MDLPTALLDDLCQLSGGVGLADNELGARLDAVVQAMRAAVRSYRGMDLTAYDGDQPVSLAAFLDTDDRAVTTSLRLPLALVGAGSHPDSRVVFYAATPGAFVDLAADLDYALSASMAFRGPRSGVTDRPDGDGHDMGHRDGHGSIVLDADLPPRTMTSGLTGVDEVSTVNRAVGMLIAQGHPPDEANHTLRRHAAAAGVEPHVYAAQMLKG